MVRGFGVGGLVETVKLETGQARTRVCEVLPVVLMQLQILTSITKFGYVPLSADGSLPLY